MDPAKMDAVRSARTGAFHAIISALLDPEDIANLALFLAPDESCYINGAIIPADAGWRAA
jgi:NAD(P)-dependent dehydrogenase (short-subunit alcohol dehydrogenase family)